MNSSKVHWGRVWEQLSLRGERSEKVPTQRMLMVCDMARALNQINSQQHPLAFLADVLQVHTQGGVTAEERLRQGIRIIDFWPGDILEAIMLFDGVGVPPWHSLYEPTRWDDADKVRLVESVRRSVHHGQWPSVGAMRAAAGRRRNHALPGEQPGQGQLI